MTKANSEYKPLSDEMLTEHPKDRYEGGLVEQCRRANALAKAVKQTREDPQWSDWVALWDLLDAYLGEMAGCEPFQ